MSPIHFYKLESVGNDFPLIFSDDLPAGLSLNDLAIKICDRRFGVGGDGLLTLQAITRTLLILKMFNPDGTEDFCGNGLRCAAHLAFQKGLVGDTFTIEHLGKRVAIHIEGESIRSEIGIADYSPSVVPLAESVHELFDAVIYENGGDKIYGSALSTGSTHVILPIEELPSDEDFSRLGPTIENLPLFPIRTSVIWTKKLSPDHVQIRIWERGVGETYGCGTGSSAAVADLLRRENRGGTIAVQSVGGTLQVSAAGWNAPLTVEGSAKIVYEGELPE